MKSRIVLSFLLLFSAVNLANPQANTQQPVLPNAFEFSGGNLHIGYDTTSMGGVPTFSYHDGSQTLYFRGKEIQQEKSAIGTLVTVTIRRTVDAGSTTFTLLVPTVTLKENSTAQVHTYGITTEHKFSVMPAKNLGQKETYTTTELSGTAQSVFF